MSLFRSRDRGAMKAKSGPYVGHCFGFPLARLLSGPFSSPTCKHFVRKTLEIRNKKSPMHTHHHRATTSCHTVVGSLLLPVLQPTSSAAQAETDVLQKKPTPPRFFSLTQFFSICCSDLHVFGSAANQEISSLITLICDLGSDPRPCS